MLHKLLGKVRQIYCLGGMHSDRRVNWLDFEVKGQGHNETKYGHNSTFGAILSPQNFK